MMNSLVLSILSGIGGLAVGVVIMMITSRLGLNRDQQKAKLLLEEAQIKSENLVRQAVLDGRTQAYELKLAAEKEVKERKQELQDKENKLTRREDNLNFRDETLTAKEKQIENKNSQITDKLNVLEKMETQLQAKIDNQIVELERIASMSADDAKKELMDAVEKKMDKEVSVYIREREDEARSKAADSRPYDHPYPERIKVFKITAAVFHSLTACLYRILGKQVGSSQFLFIKCFQRIKILYLSRYLYIGI